MIEPPALARELASMARSGEIDRLPPQQRSEALLIMEQLSTRGVMPFWQTFFPDQGPLRRELYARHLEFFRAGAKYPERCFMSGNRIGKTVCGAYESRCHLTGVYPEWWEGKRFNEPIRMWGCGVSNEKLYEIVQPNLLGGTKRQPNGKFLVLGNGMIEPERIIQSTARFKSGSVTGLVASIDIRYRDSLVETSTLEFKAYAQKRTAFEGTAQHVIWCDEEPPGDVYSECMTRLGTTSGIMMLTFTPIAGHTEVVEQFLTPDMRPASASDRYTEE